MQTQVQFYATPHEQQEWFTRVLRFPGAWCYLQSGGSYRELSASSETLPEFALGADDGPVFYIGNNELSQASWNHGEEGPVSLDFLHSQAVQFLPSIFIPARNLLLEGRIAISEPRKYREAGIAHSSVHEWFRRVTDEFHRSVANSEQKLVQLTTSGTRKVWPTVVVSVGAAQLSGEGTKLKQFSNGSVEFGLTNSEM